MKKIYLFLLAIACSLAFAGCSDDDDTVADVLEIVSSDIGFDAAGGTGSITLRTSETSVDATSDKSWLTITNATASTVSYSVAENADALQRSAKITISAGTTSRVVTILQSGALFDISTQSVELDPTGQTSYRIGYDTSMASIPEVSVPETAQWLSATVEDGEIILTADLNYTGARSAVITITQGWKPVEITVTQEMVDLLDVKELAFDRESATVTVTPTEYLALAASSWDVTTDDAWITLSKDGDEAFAVEVSENTTGSFRSGTVDLKSDGGEVLFSLNVSQKTYSYEFFLGDWMMNYGSGLNVQVTLSADPEDTDAYIMTGLRNYSVHVGYEDRGETAALTITCPQFIGTVNYTTSSSTGTANLYLFPTTTSATGFNRSEGIGYDCIYNLNETAQTLTPQANATTSITINGLIFAGQDVSSGSWINFGNYHPLTSFTR